MTVEMLSHVLLGLPRSSVIQFSINGKLYKVDVIGITRTQDLPDPRRFHGIREAIVLSNLDELPKLEEKMEIKRVYKTIKGREGEE